MAKYLTAWQPMTRGMPTHPQAVVFVCANLDSAYFVLLDHFLTCRWAAPPVPPPHDYFAAIVASHPGGHHTLLSVPNT